MYSHNKAQQSKNRVHISWAILYLAMYHLSTDILLSYLYWCSIWLQELYKRVEFIVNIDGVVTFYIGRQLDKLKLLLVAFNIKHVYNILGIHYH